MMQARYRATGNRREQSAGPANAAGRPPITFSHGVHQFSHAATRRHAWPTARTAKGEGRLWSSRWRCGHSSTARSRLRPLGIVSGESPVERRVRRLARHPSFDKRPAAGASRPRVGPRALPGRRNDSRTGLGLHGAHGVLQLIRRRVRTIRREMVVRGPELDVAGHRLGTG